MIPHTPPPQSPNSLPLVYPVIIMKINIQKKNILSEGNHAAALTHYYCPQSITNLKVQIYKLFSRLTEIPVNTVLIRVQSLRSAVLCTQFEAERAFQMRAVVEAADGDFKYDIDITLPSMVMTSISDA